MSYIAPNGKIWFLHNVPLDKTYQNTLYWESYGNLTGRQRQLDYFIGDDINPSTFVKYRFTNQYYTRHEKGSIRVATLADNILDCNYLVFQNTSFLDASTNTSKYFFAFITSVEYINNSVAQVNFEIDVIQTWYFDYILEPCFVERMHVRTDTVGSWLEPEPVEPGEYEYSKIYKDEITGQLVVIVAVVQVENAQSQGTVYSNIYGGTTLWAFATADVAGINAKISEYIVSPDSIVSIYMCPRCLIKETESLPNRIPDGGVQLQTSNIKTGSNLLSTTMPQRDTSESFGNFTPHNKKLYTYPFTFLEVYTPFGANAKYRYEFFANGTPSFVYGGCITQPVELVIVPTQYKDINPSQLVDLDLLMLESVSLKDYPMCSWNVDAFKAWVAQNSVPLGISVAANSAGQAIGLAGSLATGNPLAILGRITGIAGQMVGDVTNIVSQTYTASIQADKLNGQTNGSASVGMNAHGFYFAKTVVNECSARIIDSFFDRFGYSIKRIIEPQRMTRYYYTYVKTLGCTIHGSIPADDEDKICQLHDTGITYWNTLHTHDIGNFNLANSVTGNYPLGGS